MAQAHHILLLGGTGLCGQVFARAALDQGHRLTLYVRTPSKLSPDLSNDPRLEIIEGTYDDIEGLQRAAACGADTFISLAGPTLGKREGTPITEALKRLYPLLLRSNPRLRILVLSTPSYTAPQDKRNLKWFISINGYVRVIGGDSYEEIRGIATETVALGDNVDWTVFRVPLLHDAGTLSLSKPDSTQHESSSHVETDGSTGTASIRSSNEEDAGVHAVFVGDKHDGLWLERGRLARWILGELKEKRWMRLCPLVSDS